MRFTGGSVAEEKRRNGKSFNPKHWRICLSFTFEEEQPDGSTKKKRKRVSRITEGTKAQAYELRDQLIEDLDNQGNLLDEVVQKQAEQATIEGMTLTKMIQLWHNSRITAGKASDRTLSDDHNRLKRIEAHLGNLPIKDINAQTIEATYAAIRSEGNLSGTTMNHIRTLLKNVFQKAIDHDYIYKNPCAHVATPKRNDPNHRALSAEDGARLLKAINTTKLEAYAHLKAKEARMMHIGKDRDRTKIRGIHHIGCIMAVRIGLATGLRRGEVFALTWNDVDLDRGTIHVGHSVTNRDKRKVPKTKAGVRTVAVGPETLHHLAAWKTRQGSELSKLSVQQTDETPVCCSDIGSRYRVNNFTHWWDSWRKENKFEDLKFHELRHTQATMLLANGVDVKTVQTRLGHANPSITLGWYAHAIPENDRAAADMLGNLFGNTDDEDKGYRPKSVSGFSSTSQFRHRKVGV